MAEFVGYHGTRTSSAHRILRENFDLNRCKVGWAGRGVYFFEDNEKLARNFARRTRRTTDIAVIRCHISVPDERVCDLTLPTNQGAIEFQEYRLELLRQLHDNCLKVLSPDEFVDGRIIELMCDAYGYHLVRKATYTYSELDTYGEWKFRSYVPNGIELCLRSTQYITDMTITWVSRRANDDGRSPEGARSGTS